MKAIWGKDCSGDTIAPNASAEVKAHISSIVKRVNKACGGNAFIALERNDGAWIFVPIMGNQANRSLCSLWPAGEALDYDVRSETEDKSNRRKFDKDQVFTLFTGIDKRYQRIKAACAKKLGFTA
ncbi:hypothetical protein AQZ52_02115 [Novosphingobium fuchskuhlense]|uniref:Uncharacterized protein n=1 Tax=Novosphingobium fuchskuhlense TaxID=1117702 RepID=A0A124JVC2_9SPHN|nr:hypothetical protein [Novosphingobium fuchskuhlense]KUR72125.1 hypothetical protein AQZ52_02115 [Novosphingobium fuchskuhlense]